ncbi:hypothetical protein NDU88_001438 [Pleurodeles waltl]|uniref:Uncharacterized protein n=1 Tax=Pleurodeles waltl TaxID=8319 RepID=A0AAV7THN0_PLEWA|nr:hypothetical protein NDU88_001438 [Pleurodeles waltl]
MAEEESRVTAPPSAELLGGRNVPGQHAKVLFCGLRLRELPLESVQVRHAPGDLPGQGTARGGRNNGRGNLNVTFFFFFRCTESGAKRSTRARAPSSEKVVRYSLALALLATEGERGWCRKGRPKRLVLAALCGNTDRLCGQGEWVLAL